MDNDWDRPCNEREAAQALIAIGHAWHDLNDAWMSADIVLIRRRLERVDLAVNHAREVLHSFPGWQ